MKMKGNFKIFAMKTLKAYLFIGSIPFVVGSLPLESESNPESYNFDQTCSDVCIENYFMLPPIVNVNTGFAYLGCVKGCRFFGIIQMAYSQDFNASKDKCFSWCKSYSKFNKKMREACNYGCDYAILIAKKDTSSELSNSLQPQEDQENQDTSIPEDQPIIQKTDFKTLPITKEKNQPFLMSFLAIFSKYPLEGEIKEENPTGQRIESNFEKGDWLDCASRNSGIPKWMLLTAILLAVLAALWLSLSYDDKEVKEEVLCKETEKTDFPKTKDDDKKYLQDDFVKIDLLKEVEYSGPPSYSSLYQNA